MTWNKSDAQRQRNTPKQRQAISMPPSREQELPHDTRITIPRTSAALPTVEAQTLFGSGIHEDDPLMSYEDERTLLEQGMMPERHWKRIRQWMYRGIAPLS